MTTKCYIGVTTTLLIQVASHFAVYLICKINWGSFGVMSCHGCAKKFNFFVKEVGCSKCGFSFCTTCIKQNDKQEYVCSSCLEGRNTNTKVRPPPDALLKRLESLDNPAKPPITMYYENQHMKQLKDGLDPADKEIVERLEKLRERKREMNVPNEEEIAKRLAALRGENFQVSQKKPQFTQDTRTDEERTDDLIKQLLEEQIIAAKCNPEDDLRQRLNKLQGKEHESKMDQCANMNIDEPVAELYKMKESTNTVGIQEGLKNLNVEEKNSDDDDDEAVEHLVKKAMDEASLPEIDVQDTTEDNIDEEPEFPWCIICNEDATIRCLGCDGDLYCKKCYSEGHDVWSMKEHKTVPFKKK